MHRVPGTAVFYRTIPLCCSHVLLVTCWQQSYEICPFCDAWYINFHGSTPSSNRREMTGVLVCRCISLYMRYNLPWTIFKTSTDPFDLEFIFLFLFCLCQLVSTCHNGDVCVNPDVSVNPDVGVLPDGLYKVITLRT